VPLKHLLGSVAFHKHDFKVDARALVPRQETEELVDWLIANVVPPPATVLDMGCGSGVIGLSLAAAWPTPFSPPSGSTQWHFQEPLAESKFLAFIHLKIRQILMVRLVFFHMNPPPAETIKEWKIYSEPCFIRLTVDAQRVEVAIADDDRQRNYYTGCSLADYATQVPSEGWTSLRQIVADDFPDQRAEIEAFIVESLRRSLPPPLPPAPPVPSGFKRVLGLLFGQAGRR
jgi:hypothetical protein